MLNGVRCRVFLQSVDKKNNKKPKEKPDNKKKKRLRLVAVERKFNEVKST